ncbi:hypothetical protein MKW92_053161 [Papaver armeniacum]|nr:hypothetical protein MKW92_053161 [Papaver armeniacum]
MTISMDLNAFPIPEDDEEEIFGEQVEEEIAHIETAVETLRREREERRQRLKRDFPDEGPKRVVQQPRREPVINTRSYDKTKLPPGWLDCPAAGHPIGYIIPSKVPLGETFNDCIIPEIGLVIDLTNTTRYYQPSDWKKQGIKHVKIACKGKDSVPDPESVNTFVYEVLQFYFRQQQSKNKKYILVHCTHGHNRTGIMIVHFLMRSQPLSVTNAIETFHNARPPGIYKQDYIDALYALYHETKPEKASCPNTPEWKRSSDLNGEAMPDDEDDGGIVTTSQDNQVPAEVLTNDDVLGDAIPWAQQEAMRQICYHSLKLGAGTKGNAQFPGSHPVSLNRENLQLLRQRYYYATWKADGTRYMMLITSDGCFLIDRNFNFRRVQMRFPMKQTNEGHHLTLLDGEMVIDTLPDTQKKQRRFLVYDLMAINSVSIVERPFSERWEMLQKEVIEPRNRERDYIHQSRNPDYRYDLEPFRVRRKDFWSLSTVTKLLQEFIPNKLSHEADGLIFQGWHDPYVPRTHEGLLKWKYREMNSVDFLFEVVDENRQLLYLYERGKKKLMDGNHVDFKNGEDPSELSGKIIECSWDFEEQVWNCMRVRVDKSTPNDINTYRKVMRSIKDNITEEFLLEDIGEIVRLPMYNC